ncbi:hypothetical protein LCGC14_1685560 [marine sediment metagenome]|uniref:Uncharacterized protein n=1 Tax=marine sediment metagenome TaxID=412755 RepID=A0A0F9KMD6_9ZZZZ
MAESPSLLSAEWINQRILHVWGDIDRITDRIMYQGVLSSGYLPLEQPIDMEIVDKLTPEQFFQAREGLQSPPEQEILDQMMQESVQD